MGNRLSQVPGFSCGKPIFITILNITINWWDSNHPKMVVVYDSGEKPHESHESRTLSIFNEHFKPPPLWLLNKTTGKSSFLKTVNHQISGPVSIAVDSEILHQSRMVATQKNRCQLVRLVVRLVMGDAVPKL